MQILICNYDYSGHRLLCKLEFSKEKAYNWAVVCVSISYLKFFSPGCCTSVAFLPGIQITCAQMLCSCVVVLKFPSMSSLPYFPTNLSVYDIWESDIRGENAPPQCTSENASACMWEKLGGSHIAVILLIGVQKQVASGKFSMLLWHDNRFTFGYWIF